jgi:hypothetical protein
VAWVALKGEDPFDEATMLDDIEPPPLAEHPVQPVRPEAAPVLAEPARA